MAGEIKRKTFEGYGKAAAALDKYRAEHPEEKKISRDKVTDITGMNPNRFDIVRKSALFQVLCNERTGGIPGQRGYARWYVMDELVQLFESLVDPVVQSKLIAAYADLGDDEKAEGYSKTKREIFEGTRAYLPTDRDAKSLLK